MDEKTPLQCETSEDSAITERKKEITIEEVENGFVVRSSFRTRFVATNLEEAITLVRDALK